VKFNKQPNQHDSEKYANHIEGKQESREERKRDREDIGECVLCFDIQNVFSLPQGNVFNIF